MNSAAQETAQTGIDRSRARRATVKKYYIYVVLALIVVVFSLLKLDEVPMFGRGHFLGRDSIINLLRTAVPAQKQASTLALSKPLIGPQSRPSARAASIM